MTRGRIVVFGDHTPGAVRALRWALAEAERRGAAVTVVRPFDPAARSDLALENDLIRARRDSRCRTQCWVIEAVGDLDTPVPVGISTPDGPAVEALARSAETADLVVLGADGPDADALAGALRPLCACPVHVVTAAEATPAA